MNSETPENPSHEPMPEENQPWTPPQIKKMDIEETAISGGVLPDADGAS